MNRLDFSTKTRAMGPRRDCVCAPVYVFCLTDCVPYLTGCCSLHCMGLINRTSCSHAYVSRHQPSSIIWYWPRADIHCCWKGTTGLVESTGFMSSVTGRLTVEDWDQLPEPCVLIEYGMRQPSCLPFTVY